MEQNEILMSGFLMTLGTILVIGILAAFTITKMYEIRNNKKIISNPVKIVMIISFFIGIGLLTMGISMFIKIYPSIFSN